MSSWDDGKHKNVKKIEIKHGNGRIHSIKVDYETDGKLFSAPKRGGNGGDQLDQIELEKGEYLTAVTGYYTETAQGEVVTSLKFQSNKRSFGPYGTQTRNYFSLNAPKDKQILGFFGSSSGGFLGSIDAHLGPITPVSESGGSDDTGGSTPGGSDDNSVKLEAHGGDKGGSVWDDGVYDTVRKIYVGQGENGVQYIKFEYEKDGKVIVKEHGQMSLLGTEEFELEYPDEYLVRVEGYYEKVFGHEDAVIQSVKFVTNKGRISQPFGLEAANHFKLENNGSKIIGFHGRVGDMLFSLGAYTVKSATPLTPAGKLEAQGGKAGIVWDDGAHDTVRKIYVGQGGSGVQYVKFEYDKGGQPVEKEHGKMSFIEPEEFELQYPDEYLVRIEGYYDKVFGHEDAIIQSLKFVTNKGRVSQPFGLEASPKNHFTLENNGNKIIGFHGRVGEMLSSIGVYTVTTATPLAPGAKKLQAQGGSGGNQWDDGDFDNVTKIFVGQGIDGIQYIKFEYEKNGQRVSGQDHGEKTAGAEEFVLDPNEYLISVEGSYEKASGYNAPVIQSIAFKTNVKTSMTYGFEIGTSFLLKEQGSKIVGFHGSASKVIHGLGVYAKPISK